jgi:hypothetical protein
MTMKYRAALLVYLALLWPAHLAHAQQSAAPAPLAAEAHLDAQLLRALLEEVRQLRLAVQKGSLSQHRSQLLLERIARQQDRVEGLNAEIEQVREQLQVLSQPGRYDEELKGMEEAISSNARSRSSGRPTRKSWNASASASAPWRRACKRSRPGLPSCRSSWRPSSVRWISRSPKRAGANSAAGFPWVPARRSRSGQAGYSHNK